MWEVEKKEIDEEFGIGPRDDRSGIYRMKEKNKIRILKGGEKDDKIVRHFVNGKYVVCFGKIDGCPYHGADVPRGQIQIAFYVLDRTIQGSPIQPAFLPYSVFNSLQMLSAEDEYAFKSLPMPYDITINYSKMAAPNDKYKVIPSPTKAAVPAAIVEELAKKDPLKDIVSRLRANSKKAFEGAGKELPPIEEEAPTSVGFSGDDDASVDEIPF